MKQREYLINDLIDYMHFCQENKLQMDNEESMRSYVEKRTPEDFELVRINEGQEIGNTKTIITKRPNVQPAPQKAKNIIK